MKTLGEMTTSELTSLKDDIYAAYREVERKHREMPVGARGWSELADSRDAIRAQYFRIDDELDRRGA